MERIKRYFPEFSDEQLARFAQLPALYVDWNEKINVVSRKDMDFFVERHLLHSLALARYVIETSNNGKGFAPGSRIVDVGCGGGLPSIPLAIAFPDCSFTAMDSIGKKVKVAEAIAQAVGLKNLKAVQARSTDVRDEKFDYITSRGVTAFPDFEKQTRHLIESSKASRMDDVQFVMPRGILYLKGGDFGGEVNRFGKRVQVTDIKKYFDEEFFETKRIIWLRE